VKEVLLSVRDLKTYFFTSLGVVKAVDGMSYDIHEGEIVGLVGESASGKSVSALSVMRLVPEPPGRIVGGQILFKGEDLLKKSEDEMRMIRGGNIAMSFQDPMTYLNPVFRIYDQITEAILLHQKVEKEEAIEKTIKMMEMVKIPQPSERSNDYPHHFSGGMRQRILLAMATCCNPDILIADEPTTALDVVVQREILDLLKDMKQRLNSAILLITHDLGIVAQLADRVAIMYSGRIQEMADVYSIFGKPRHPYTMGLLNSIPKLEKKGRLVAIDGEIPDPLKPPSGCRFHPRCPFAENICRTQEPATTTIDENHSIACHRFEEI
jgi:peptide/nickel transport system ATP-binding protein/oligopeptide transport system ATP-binding protein